LEQSITYRKHVFARMVGTEVPRIPRAQCNGPRDRWGACCGDAVSEPPGDGMEKTRFCSRAPVAAVFDASWRRAPRPGGVFFVYFEHFLPISVKMFTFKLWNENA